MSSAPLADPRALGVPIKGPTALGSDWRRFVRLTWALAITDFKLRFFGSALGYLWQFMHPLMLFGVLYLVFSWALNFGNDVVFYPQSLLLGIVLYTFLAEATTGSVRSLMVRESLVRKVEFPRLAVPLSVVVTSVMNLCLNILPVFVFLIAAGGSVRWSWLALIPIFAVLVLFVAGLSALLSAMFVPFRDVEPIWAVVLQAMFYASGIFFTLQMVADKTGSTLVPKLLLLNPFATLLQDARHYMIDPSYPTSADVFGGAVYLLLPLGVVVVTVVAGAVVFSRMAPRVAEEL